MDQDGNDVGADGKEGMLWSGPQKSYPKFHIMALFKGVKSADNTFHFDFKRGRTKLNSCHFDYAPTLRAYLARIWHIQHLLWLLLGLLLVSVRMANVRLKAEDETQVWLFEPHGPRGLSLVRIRVLI